MNYLLPIEDFGTAAISIGSVRRFGQSEIVRFQTIEPLVLSMLKSQWGSPANQQQNSTEHIS